MTADPLPALPILQPPAFCAYAAGECDQDFAGLAEARGLFLYGSKPPEIPSTLSRAAQLLSELGTDRFATWRQMDTAGHIIFCEICKSMRGAAAVYADVTTLNFNLMFEIGFAIGLGLPVRPVRDPTYAVDKKLFDSVGVLDTLGYIEFTHAQQLADSIRNAPRPSPLPMAHVRPARQTPLYVLKGPIETDGAVKLLSLIKKSYVGFRSLDPIETPRLSLHAARRDVAASFGVIAHLLSPNREGATAHNGLCAFICGLAVAEQKPVLMLQEGAATQPIDYRDLVRSYDAANQIGGLLGDTLGAVVERLQDIPSVSPAPLQGILDELDLGNVAAENEISGLRQYFVRTSRFRQVRQGHAQVVVGRKGAGKTALFYGLRQAVKRGREVLVLDMKPEGHQFTRLREAVLEGLSEGQQEYTLGAFWTYLLSAEVAHKILNSQGELNAAKVDPGHHKTYKALEDAYMAHGLQSGDDLSQRLLRQIDRLAARFRAHETIDSMTDLRELVYGGDIRTLNDAVADYLIHEKDEVWLLVDNLDKSWATRGSTREDMLLMRGLLDATQKLQQQLEDRDVAFNSVVFIRTDVYEHLVGRTPDRGKDRVVRLDWEDQDIFRQIVRARVTSSTDLKGEFEEVWPQVASSLVGIQDAFTYIADRTLLRPRDLLMFLGDAVQVALDRGHDRIESQDILDAEDGYSLDMLHGLVFEIEDTHPELSEAVYAFRGSSAELTRSGVEDRLQTAGVAEPDLSDAIELLVWYGFIGVRAIGEDDARFSYNVRYNLRQLLHSVETGVGMFVIHPAFRAALGIG
jgi:hypothetical protein